jgi:Trehalase
MTSRLRPAPRLARAEREALLAGAQAILDANWTGHSTVASRTLYPHQWSWDAAFIAIGRAWRQQELARLELESLLAGQWANGMVPHIVFNPAVAPGDYFPGPEFWDAGRGNGHRGPGPGPPPATSGILQPPLHARAALEVHRRATDQTSSLAFLARVYPKLVAWHDYLAERRDVAGHGLAALVHPWESGMDNSPIWDQDLDELVIPAGAVPPYRRQDLVHADPADRPTDAAYDRFVYLAMAYRDAGYDDAAWLARSPFLVEDPLFNAIWCWSAHALAEIAELLGHDGAPHRAMAGRIHDGLLAHLWEPASRRFLAWDVRDRHHVAKNTVSSLMPLLDPDLPAEQVASIVAELGSPHFHAAGAASFLVPSYDLASPDFDRRRYWRGPVWINIDWLIWRGLRQHGAPAVTDGIARSMTQLVRRSGFREYFDPFTGEGYGSHDFSWTAALLIDLLLTEDRPAW